MSEKMPQINTVNPDDIKDTGTSDLEEQLANAKENDAEQAAELVKAEQEKSALEQEKKALQREKSLLEHGKKFSGEKYNDYTQKMLEDFHDGKLDAESLKNLSDKDLAKLMLNSKSAENLSSLGLLNAHAQKESRQREQNDISGNKEEKDTAKKETLREQKISEYKKIGYDFDVKAYEGLHSSYIKGLQEAQKNKDDVGVKEFKKRLDNIENELFTIKMVTDILEDKFKDTKKQFEAINTKFAKIQMEARKLGQIKGILKLVDVDSLGKKRKIEGNIFKKGYLKTLNYMSSTDRKNAITRFYNLATARGTNENFKEKLVQAQALMNRDTASLSPEEVKLLKSIDLKRVSGALNEDVTRTSFDNTADGGNYVGTEIIDNTKADFTKKMEKIQQLDSRAMKMEGLNFKNRLKIWAENPANIRRLKSKLRIGGTAALLTGGLSNIGMLGSLGMFGARAVGALGGGEIFKNTYKKFATMPYQQRMALMRTEMQKNGDYLKKIQAGEIDSAVAKKIDRDNFGQMAAYVPGAIGGALVGGGFAEMNNGGEFLDPTKRLLKVPGKIGSSISGGLESVGNSMSEGFDNVKDYFSGETASKINSSNITETFDSTGTSSSGTIDDSYGPQLEGDVKNEIKIPFAHDVESTSTPYEKFMENYAVEESSKIRKGEGIYHALMRQTGNDKARVMALLKKHDYIKFNDAGELIKDVRVKDGMGAAYDIVTINGKETIIESVNGSPCHCDEFDVVEVKKACDASDLTTGKLERQEYVHTYTERPRVAVRVPDEVAREYEYLPHQNEIRTHTIEKHYITNTEYIKSEPEIRYETKYVDRYIERPVVQEKITPKVREMVKQGRTRELRKMEERGEIKVERKKGRFWKWLGRLGTDVLANEISYQIHKGDHGQDIIVCNHPSGGTVETGGQTDPIDGGHNPANEGNGNTGNTNEEVGGGHNGGRGRRTGNGESVPNDLDGRSARNTNSRRTTSQRTSNSGRARTQKELYERENSQLRKERVSRNTNSRNSTSTRRTSTRNTRGTNSSSRGGTQRTTSTGKSGGVRGRSNRSGR